jgi:hypothetical protein
MSGIRAKACKRKAEEKEHKVPSVKLFKPLCFILLTHYAACIFIAIADKSKFIQ